MKIIIYCVDFDNRFVRIMKTMMVIMMMMTTMMILIKRDYHILRVTTVVRKTTYIRPRTMRKSYIKLGNLPLSIGKLKILISTY